jgi:hypothetical protein
MKILKIIIKLEGDPKKTEIQTNNSPSFLT